MSVLCPAVRATLDILGEVGLAGPLHTHAETCETCSAELGNYKTASNAIAGLPADEFRTDPQFVESVMQSLGPVAVPDLEPKHSKVVPIAAAVATAAVATAAAGTAVLLRVRRARAA